MSLYRGRVYSVEEIEKLIFVRRYKEEMRLYDVQTFDYNGFSRDFVEDNLVNTANAMLLMAIERYLDKMIEVDDFNYICDSVITYMDNCELLGKMKTFHKIMALSKILNVEPFVATT